MSRETIHPKNEKHWLDLRTQDITSTEIGALFGLSPYVTEYELWFRKKNQTVVDFEESERMKWGTVLQDAIAKGIAEEQGWTIRRMDEYIRGSDLRIGASFDFSIEATKKGLLEIKNVDGLIFKQQWQEDEAGNLEAPLHIEIQVQHQLLISGREYAYIGVLVGGNKLVLLKRERNKVVLDKIKEKAKLFWDSIDNNTPPQPNFQTDSQFIASLYGYSEPGKLMDLTTVTDIEPMAQEYKKLGAENKENDTKRSELKARMLTIIGDSEKAMGELFTISAGMVGPTHVSYDRKGYRNFRITWKKVKKQ